MHPADQVVAFSQLAFEHGARPELEATVARLDIDFAKHVRPAADMLWSRIRKDRILDVARLTLGTAWASARSKYKKADLATAMEEAFTAGAPPHAAALAWTTPGFAAFDTGGADDDTAPESAPADRPADTPDASGDANLAPAHKPRKTSVVESIESPAVADRRPRQPVRKLRHLQHCRPHMPHMARHLAELGRDLPASRTHDEHRLAPFSGHHADRRHKVRVVRYHRCGVEQSFPCVIQEVGSEIDVRSLLFHRVKFGDQRIRQRGRRFPPPPPARATCRVAAHGQRLPVGTRDRVIAFRQRHRRQRIDPPAGDRQVGQWPPHGLREKAPEMHLDFRKRAQRAQISVLAGRPARVRYSWIHGR